MQKTSRHAHLGPGQRGLHPRLAEVVQRHLEHPWLRPIAQPTRQVFESIGALLASDNRPLVLDSGCGTGASSLALAQQHPDCLVIGIDRSAHRLAARGIEAGRDWCADGGALFVRAECADFWRLLAAANWPLRHHFLLYPNPWPKARHLTQRWYGHPVFPCLMALPGTLELRTNRSLYAQEFCSAAVMLGADAQLRSLTDGQEFDQDLTPFERKYRQRGDRLWQVKLACRTLSASVP